MTIETTTALLLADSGLHVAGAAGATGEDAARDRAAMVGGAAAYLALAVACAKGSGRAELLATAVPAMGIAGLLATWGQSTVPSTIRAAIVAVDVGLVARGLAARRSAPSDS
ncbi:MAG: hypothetical protein S0880_14220 [Actinomycetota bacterium]|nr:hypothetical protein [Actinomycetota bacterium]